MRLELGSPRAVFCTADTLFDFEEALENERKRAAREDEEFNEEAFPFTNERVLITVPEADIDPAKAIIWRVENENIYRKYRKVRFGNWIQVAVVRSEKGIRNALFNYLSIWGNPGWLEEGWYDREGIITETLTFATGPAIRLDLTVMKGKIGIWHDMSFLGSEFKKGNPQRKFYFT